MPLDSSSPTAHPVPASISGKNSIAIYAFLMCIYNEKMTAGNGHGFLSILLSVDPLRGVVS